MNNSIYLFKPKNQTEEEIKKASNDWLNYVCRLRKDFDIKISFKSKNPFIFNFILATNKIKSYTILSPNFGEISFHELIEDKLKGFKITEANKELENKMLNK